jgi:ferredoxin
MNLNGLTRLCNYRMLLRSPIRKLSKEHLHVTLNWTLKNGTTQKTQAEVGISLMEVAHRNNIDLEGACAGVCACSTCHVILDDHVYDNLPEPEEKEEDMLDQAFGLSTTSRLGCQVKVEGKHDGITIKLPQATRNFYVVCRRVSYFYALY